MVCSDSVIQVQNIVTYCDSPGTFYYGSGKYRDSQTCQPGDKARVLINFYIANHDIIQQAGNYALVDVYADGGYYTDSVTIYDAADLCSLSSLKIKGRNQCPYNGYYQIKTHFYWGKSGQDETFEPVIHVGFKSNIKKNVYDYGGANTNLCRGSTFLTWSDGVRVSYANAVGNFMKSFGILLLTILFLGILAWFLSNRPRSFKEAKAKLLAFHRFPRTFRGQTHRDLSMHPDEEFDFRKIQTAGNRDLVDF
jgi:cbb3-type cytochrome oxidase subunit 3